MYDRKVSEKTAMKLKNKNTFINTNHCQSIKVVVDEPNADVYEVLVVCKGVDTMDTLSIEKFLNKKQAEEKAAKVANTIKQGFIGEWKLAILDE